MFFLIKRLFLSSESMNLHQHMVQNTNEHITLITFKLFCQWRPWSDICLLLFLCNLDLCLSKVKFIVTVVHMSFPVVEQCDIEVVGYYFLTWKSKWMQHWCRLNCAPPFFLLNFQFLFERKIWENRGNISPHFQLYPFPTGHHSLKFWPYWVVRVVV